MARVVHYRTLIKRLLEQHAQYVPATGHIEMETIFDEPHDRYQLMAIGWQGHRRVHGCVIHIDLKGEKVWIQHDSTDADIANTLVEMGIPAEHIVLGFQPEHYRQHTGFAVH